MVTATAKERSRKPDKSAALHQWAWPDGQPYTEQETLVVEIFSIIRHEVQERVRG